MNFPGVTSVSRLRQPPDAAKPDSGPRLVSRLRWEVASHIHQNPRIWWRQLAGAEAYQLSPREGPVGDDHFLRQEAYHSRPFFIGEGEDLVLSRHAKAVLAPGAGLVDELNVGGGAGIPKDLLAGDLARRPGGWAIGDLQIERVAGDTVPFCHYGMQAFGHFVLDGLLQVFLFERELRDGRAKLVHWPFSKPWMYAGLSACDVPANARIEVSAPAVLLQRTLLSSALAGHGAYFPCSVSRRFFAWLRLKLLGREKTTSTGRRAYLRRSDTSPRRILNAFALEELVASHGFDIVSPEELSLPEQAALYADAELVMSPWGSTLTLAPLLGGRRHVIELLPASVTDPWFVRQAAVHGLAYTPILHESAPNGDFEADLDRIEFVLSGLP